jgi:2-keto-myo-inositol isomerase
VAQNVPLSLNRIAKPQLPLAEFLKLTAELGMKYAEVRNDFAEKGVLDGLSEAELGKALAATGVRIVTINALYPFEHGDHLAANLEKLKALIAEARKVSCPHIVMCPFNERGDTRTPAQRASDLVAALNAYGPLFAGAGMVGLIEPLGFERSSLRTKRAALDGIARCSHPKAFALLHDTFHHYLSGETEFFPAETALIHVSGVAKGKPRAAIQDDDDRILVDASDAMDNKGQVATLLARGCKAIVSFEPFGPSVRAMPVPELKRALQESVKYLLG